MSGPVCSACIEYREGRENVVWAGMTVHACEYVHTQMIGDVVPCPCGCVMRDSPLVSPQSVSGART